MDCKDCSLSDICIVAHIIRTHSMHMDITVDNCQRKTNMKSNTESSKAVQAPVYKSYKDFSQISNDVRNKEKGAECKVKISTDTTAVDSSLEKVQCPSCNATTTPDDVRLCNGKDCAKPVCSNCGTEVDGKMYCESCWSTM